MMLPSLTELMENPKMHHYVAPFQVTRHKLHGLEIDESLSQIEKVVLSVQHKTDTFDVVLGFAKKKEEDPIKIITLTSSRDFTEALKVYGEVERTLTSCNYHIDVYPPDIVGFRNIA